MGCTLLSEHAIWGCLLPEGCLLPGGVSARGGFIPACTGADTPCGQNDRQVQKHNLSATVIMDIHFSRLCGLKSSRNSSRLINRRGEWTLTLTLHWRLYLIQMSFYVTYPVVTGYKFWRSLMMRTKWDKITWWLCKMMFMFFRLLEANHNISDLGCCYNDFKMSISVLLFLIFFIHYYWQWPPCPIICTDIYSQYDFVHRCDAWKPCLTIIASNVQNSDLVLGVLSWDDRIG